VLADLGCTATEGRRPPGIGLAHRFTDRVTQAAATQPDVFRACVRVSQLEAAPTALLTPRMLAKILLSTRQPQPNPADTQVR